MDNVESSHGVRVVKKGKKKQVKDDLDRQKQAEKKKRRLEKALANSAAIISELEKKKQKKKEEQQRLDEEGAAIAEAVALHVLGEDSDEPCHLMLNHHNCRQWRYIADLNSFPISPNLDGDYASRGAYFADMDAPERNWTDWAIDESMSLAPYFQGAFQTADISPGYIAAQAVSSLRIGEDALDIYTGSRPRTSIHSKILGSGNNRSNI